MKTYTPHFSIFEKALFLNKEDNSEVVIKDIIFGNSNVDTLVYFSDIHHTHDESFEIELSEIEMLSLYKFSGKAMRTTECW
jgi:hypothetical protein